MTERVDPSPPSRAVEPDEIWPPGTPESVTDHGDVVFSRLGTERTPVEPCSDWDEVTTQADLAAAMQPIGNANEPPGLCCAECNARYPEGAAHESCAEERIRAEGPPS